MLHNRTTVPVLGIIAAILAIGVVVSMGAWAAEQNSDKGAEQLVLAGGARGEVAFPHRQHQQVLGDCDVCHSVFPQQAGVIEKLKADGELKKKYVMTKVCTSCHREKRRAGEKSGPTTCNSCHQK